MDDSTYRYTDNTGDWHPDTVPIPWTPYPEPYEPYPPYPSDSNTYTWAGTFTYAPHPVNLYLIPKNITSYVDALDSIEGLKPMEALRSVRLFWKGEECQEKNSVLIERDIGSEPPVRLNTVSSGLFSTVKFGRDMVSSVVGEVMVRGKRLICVFGSISIESVETDFESGQGADPTEEIELISPTALPWKDAALILQEVEG
jgi:hypothetical protein